MRVLFLPTGWEDYLHWQTHDRKTLKRLNRVIEDCRRSPFEGIGKPEPLRHEWSGFWSRRITDEHRLVYAVEADAVVIAQCRYH